MEARAPWLGWSRVSPASAPPGRRGPQGRTGQDGLGGGLEAAVGHGWGTARTHAHARTPLGTHPSRYPPPRYPQLRHSGGGYLGGYTPTGLGA